MFFSIFLINLHRIKPGLSFIIKILMKTDLKYLKDLAAGDNTIIIEMIDLFSVQVKEVIADMQKAEEESDYDAISKIAHKAKSSVAIMGMHVLAEKLQELEIMARQGNSPEKYKDYINFFIQESDIAIKELTEYKTTL